MRLAIGCRVKVVIENEERDGLYYDDDRAPQQITTMVIFPNHDHTLSQVLEA